METDNSATHYKPPPHQKLDIRYIDDELIILNKPSGLLSVPGRGADKQDSLSDRVQQQFPEALTVHRLDMDTSGLILMARSKDSQRQLSQLFEQRQIEKHYMAVADGLLQPNKGEINLPLMSDWPNRPRQKVDHEHGKPSTTHYQLMHYDADQNTSLILLTPVTGRSHQIRVHLQTIGHPILGDRLYAHQEVLAKSGRLMLHASFLAFTHPMSKIRIQIECKADFQELAETGL